MNSQMKKRMAVVYPLLAGLLLLSCALSLRYGSSGMGLKEAISALLGQEGYQTQTLIMYVIRVPRTLGALLAGIGLSVSGVLLQTVTGNDLAAPNIIGVNAGAGFAVIMILYFLPMSYELLPFAAFAGAFATTMVIVAASSRTGRDKTSIILAGIAFTAVLNAAISLLSMLDTDVLSSYNAFSIGGLSGVKTEALAVPAVLIVISLICSLMLSRQLGLLALGDSMAVSLGVNVRRLRLVALLLASPSAAAVVSFAGLLGFVGLVVPHIARRITTGVRSVLITSALCGAILVVLADLVGRIIAAPSELPVGIVMSMIGAPFFFVLLLKRRGGR